MSFHEIRFQHIRLDNEAVPQLPQHVEPIVKRRYAKRLNQVLIGCKIPVWRKPDQLDASAPGPSIRDLLSQHQATSRIYGESFVMIEQKTSSFHSVNPTYNNYACRTGLPVKFNTNLGEECLGVFARESFMTRNAQTLKK
jgi:hypothetical protein